MLAEEVQSARGLLREDLCRKFFNQLIDSKLKDFCVATGLDPRYKSFKFKLVNKWRKGTLTKEVAIYSMVESCMGQQLEARGGAQYLAVPDEPADTDVLQWWKKMEPRLPNLCKMVREHLAPPASTAGVERVFSKCTFMHSDLRKELSEGMLEHSMHDGHC
ncbi:hypothetical protein CYMTET_41045 [Cymbomonas tetramitiformis]|uniref:HAT C-terminal dimerisation domain-containing protein n=1 Tax=Cymbomonas tetramitiformis TaxID=36881 RepID=A0AAE0C8W0_9CHLO|nr:hypothetical protein CYMTET_41045 [Cymbomonas tetramitiformis]